MYINSANNHITFDEDNECIAIELVMCMDLLNSIPRANMLVLSPEKKLFFNRCIEYYRGALHEQAVELIKNKEKENEKKKDI